MYIDIWHVQSNILITQAGQACLADFEIALLFPSYRDYNLPHGAVCYMSPEWLTGDGKRISKAHDIYSLSMTSFTVRSSLIGSRPT